ncbi:MAG TPA: Mut7-C RNAse domain-containing protein [Streptosporangiaceae bacterium]|nr:Mut7-C RNAse domain-containing protein [Streptosporangiaceae bacterium]
MHQTPAWPPASSRAELLVAPELRLFLRRQYRHDPILIGCDGVSTFGHVVQSAGVPLTEAGALTVNGRLVPPGYRPRGGDVMRVSAVSRPQRLPGGTARAFVLDVHLGTLARRLRLVGIDAAYTNDAGDDDLIAQANDQRRVLLTQDRRLLCRRSLDTGAYVRGAAPDDQFADVLDRFAPPLAPWTRCLACNGLLAPVAKACVDEVLRPGTRRTYQVFARCLTCGKVYWRGAHADHLQGVIDRAMTIVAAARSA